MDAIKEILDVLGIDNVDDMDINEYHTFEVEGFDDLTVEKVGENQLSVAHHRVQRMDLMSVPEIVFDIDGDEWTAVEYTNHPGVYKCDRDGLDLDGFPEQWSENLRKQGFIDTAKSEEGAA